MLEKSQNNQQENTNAMKTWTQRFKNYRPTTSL